MDHRQKYSRRAVIKLAVLATAVPLVGGVVDQAQAAKASKKQMQYQDEPKANQDCAHCLQFIPGKSAKADGECKVVAGNISPNGWCIAYAAKPS